MGIYQPRKNRRVAEIMNFGLRRNIFNGNHVPDSFSLYKQSGWPHAVRRDYTAGDEGAQIHGMKRKPALHFKSESKR